VPDKGGKETKPLGFKKKEEFVAELHYVKEGVPLFGQQRRDQATEAICYEGAEGEGEGKGVSLVQKKRYRHIKSRRKGSLKRSRRRRKPRTHRKLLPGGWNSLADEKP